MLYVSGHIDYCARNKPIKFKIWLLHKMQSDNAALRKIKEHYFINLFKPKLTTHLLIFFMILNIALLTVFCDVAPGLLKRCCYRR